MKKLISLMLALILVVSMATVAFAADYDQKVGVKPKISKTYTVNEGTAPAETFTFTFKGFSCVNNEGKTVEEASYPEIAPVEFAFDAITQNTTKTVELDIDADDYNLGVYTYEVTESVPADGSKTAGTTYNSTDKLYLVLTILLDDNQQNYVAAVHLNAATGTNNKTNVLGNTYDAGQLTVSKTISGNMADMSKKFPFTITFTAPAGTVFDKDVQIVSNGTKVLNEDGTITVTTNLGNNEKIEITNIPAGTTYTVAEDKGEYTITSEAYSDNTKIIDANESATVAFNNELNKGVDTGITLDSIPFVLMLVVCAGAAVLFVIKRRSVEF